jgi:hypothetical protein
VGGKAAKGSGNVARVGGQRQTRNDHVPMTRVPRAPLRSRPGGAYCNQIAPPSSKQPGVRASSDGRDASEALGSSVRRMASTQPPREVSPSASVRYSVLVLMLHADAVDEMMI